METLSRNQVTAPNPALGFALLCLLGIGRIRDLMRISTPTCAFSPITRSIPHCMCVSILLADGPFFSISKAAGVVFCPTEAPPLGPAFPLLAQGCFRASLQGRTYDLRGWLRAWSPGRPWRSAKHPQLCDLSCEVTNSPVPQSPHLQSGNYVDIYLSSV